MQAHLLESFLSGFCVTNDRKHGATKRKLTYLRYASLANPKLRTTRHDSPVLIFDEHNYGLLLRAAGGPAAI
jgi:hypothetical protein